MIPISLKDMCFVAMTQVFLFLFCILVTMMFNPAKSAEVKSHGELPESSRPCYSSLNLRQHDNQNIPLVFYAPSSSLPLVFLP